MSRYIAIEGCKTCPHRHYYSVGLYECLKYGTVLPASHILDIPEWCPLPKLPTPASAPETPAEDDGARRERLGLCLAEIADGRDMKRCAAFPECLCGGPSGNRGESL